MFPPPEKILIPPFFPPPLYLFAQIRERKLVMTGSMSLIKKPNYNCNRMKLSQRNL